MDELKAELAIKTCQQDAELQKKVQEMLLSHTQQRENAIAQTFSQVSEKLNATSTLLDKNIRERNNRTVQNLHALQHHTNAIKKETQSTTEATKLDTTNNISESKEYLSILKQIEFDISQGKQKILILQCSRRQLYCRK